MQLITLTSDYGPTDFYAAAVKGMLYRELPEVTLCDISHQVAPGDIHQGAFILRHCLSSFPEGTVHLVLVSELSANRRWLVMELEGQFFISADNGLMPLLAEDSARTAQFWQVDISEKESLFPGRDFLAKAACHLARGGKPSVLGRSTDEYVQGRSFKPHLDHGEGLILGTVNYIDQYGNLITNISAAQMQEVGGTRSLVIELPRSQRLERLYGGYHELSDGHIIALINSSQRLEIALTGAQGRDFNGANSMLGMKVRDTVRVVFGDK